MRWAAAHERRAASADGEEFKTVLLRVAAEYRDLALQIEDPKKWRAKQERARRFDSHQCGLRAKIG